MNIAQLIEQADGPFFSLEFFPPKEVAQQEAFYEVVDKLSAIKPLFASVTYGAGGSSQDATLDIVTRIKHVHHMEPMAHFTCVSASEKSIGEFLDKLSHAGVDNVLALRGDPPADQAHGYDWTQEPFTHAADLVRFARQYKPEMGIGVAGYPSPHPESPTFASDWRYTVAKIREGADFVITQLFFDVREYFNFVERLNDMGVSVPVIPGILPVQSLESLRRTLALCGANIPGKLYLDLEAAHSRGGAEAVKDAGIAYAVQQIRTLIDGGAPGIHLYTLNRAESCLRLVEAVRSGAL